AETHDVGEHALAHGHEHRAAAAEARPDFVADHERAEAIAEIAQAPQKKWRRNDAATASEYRLDEDGADATGDERVLRVDDRIVGFGFVRRERRERDVTTELLLERLAERCMKSARGERPIAQAVIRACERDDAAPFGR